MKTTVQPPVVRVADFIGLSGIVVGMIFIRTTLRSPSYKVRDDLLADDSNDRHANCDHV